MSETNEARMERYAQAIHSSRTSVALCDNADVESCWPLARAAIAVADEEHATLRAELEKAEADAAVGWNEAAVETAGRKAAEAEVAGLRGLAQQLRDCALRAEVDAEAAEAEVERLTAVIDHHGWCGFGGMPIERCARTVCDCGFEGIVPERDRLKAEVERLTAALEPVHDYVDIEQSYTTLGSDGGANSVRLVMRDLRNAEAEADRLQAEVERLTRECLDRDATETDARERLRRCEERLARVGMVADEWFAKAEGLAPDDDWGESITDTIAADTLRSVVRTIRTAMA